MKRLICAFFMAALPLSYNCAAFAADWPMFRADRARTGYLPEQAYPPLTQMWEFQVQGDVVAGPVASGGMVYAAARSGSVYALNAYTGELIWDYSTNDWVDAPPTVSSGTVYVPSRDGHLYALDRLTGGVLWSAALGGPSISSPLVLDGKVYVGVGAPQNMLKAFDAATGAPLWQYAALRPQPVESAPSTDGRTVYFGSNGGRVYALDKDTGQPAWTFSGTQQTMGSFGSGALPVSSGSVYALPGHDERRLLRFSAADGNQTAESAPFAELVGQASENEVTTPVISPYGVFAGAGSRPHHIYAFDPYSLSDIAFSSPSAGGTLAFGVLSSPSMANGVMYLGTVDARMLAVSSSGAVLQSLAVSSSVYTSPAVSNGWVYAGTMGGTVLGFKAALAASISYPATYQVVDGTVPVRGWLRNPALSGYLLEYGQGEAPASWTTLVSTTASSEVSGGQLGSWDVTGLANGLYTLRLTASESSPSGSLPRGMVTARVNHRPQPPVSLAAADNPGDSGNRLALSWTASPSSWVTAYNVYRAPAGGGFSYLAGVSTPAVSYLDATAVTGSTFTYAVRAFDGYDESADSPYVSAFSVNDNPSSDVVAPSAPHALAAAPGAAGGSVDLSWTAPGGDGDVGAAAGYEIRYATWPSFDWATAAVWKSTRAASGPYGTAEIETVRGLFGGVTYYFSLEAYDLNSNYSVPSAAVFAAATRDLVAPGAPGGLSVADRPGDHGGALTLSWTRSADDGAGAGDVYGYRVFRALHSGVQLSTSPYAEVGAGTAVYTDTSAPSNLKFYYAVAAFDSTNLSTATAEASGISADNWRFFDKSNGGSVRLTDGAEVSIPGDGASQNDNLLVTRLDQAEYFGTSARVKADTGGARPTGIVYEVKFENPSTTLLKPAVIYLPYTDAETASVPAASLRVYLLDGARWVLMNTSKALPEQHKVSAEVKHFSVYSLLGYVPSGALLTSDRVYTYPNPARGDTLTFRFLPADNSDVTIDVYNVAGEKVARLAKDSCPGGVTSEIVWRVANVASGVYVYRLEARSPSGTKSITKKLAIVH